MQQQIEEVYLQFKGSKVEMAKEILRLRNRVDAHVENEKYLGNLLHTGY